MKVLLLYDNFIRDFRGLLLLKYLLKAHGHKVWINATWNNPLKFAQIVDADVIVGGQIAEGSTHHVGKFAKENNIRFVLNSTENVGVSKNFEMLITYNTSELNDEMIDMQTIAAKDVYDFILTHPRVKPENKKKYKHLGFPRLDITVNESFRKIETSNFKAKYNLHRTERVYLFISSFLLDGAFDGIPQRDLDKWNISDLRKRTDDLLLLTTDILKRLVSEELKENDMLIIKKHPWDCSNYFRSNFSSTKCIVLDNNDYILPCIANADIVLHTYSTAAIEAWILEKKTISIISEKYNDSYMLNHMEQELSVSSFEELRKLINNYPLENPSKKVLEIFSPNLDGKATLRLAREIDKLSPHGLKVKFKPSLRAMVKGKLKYWLYDKGFLKMDMKKAGANTKKYDFYCWENERSAVIKLYGKHFKRYAQKCLEENI